jgi:hypothetical protein
MCSIKPALIYYFEKAMKKYIEKQRKTKRPGLVKPPAFYLNNRRQPRQTPVSTDAALYIMNRTAHLCHL